MKAIDAVAENGRCNLLRTRCNLKVSRNAVARSGRFAVSPLPNLPCWTPCSFAGLFHSDEFLTDDPDDILEANLFPQGTDSPGNRGTIDIGSSNNSTSDLARQIVHGISPEDMAHMGGSLVFEDGELLLNGDTGISAGMKDELASIIGETRCIPIFSNVSGNGNNATFTIVKFVGVRILKVKLTGSMSSKKVIIQPACIECLGLGPPTGDQKSQFVRSPVWLIR